MSPILILAPLHGYVRCVRPYLTLVNYLVHHLNLSDQPVMGDRRRSSPGFRSGGGRGPPPPRQGAQERGGYKVICVSSLHKKVSIDRKCLVIKITLCYSRPVTML